MAWPPDTINSNYLWSKVANIAPFWRAASERSEAAGLATFPIPIAGSYVNSANNSAPVTTASNFGIRFLQQRVQDLSTSYMNESLGTAPPTSFTLAAWRSQAGIHADGYRRRCPRQIATNTSTTDTEGNTIANGMYAMGVHNAADTTIRFKTYKRSGGAWSVVADPMLERPDVLDSTTAAPNFAARGILKQSDYIGSWLWDELNDGLVLLNKLVVSVTSPNGTSKSGASTGSPATWADAKASAETVYAAATPTADTSVSKMETLGSKGGPSLYSAGIATIVGTPRITVIGGLATTCKLYVRANAIETFDANGTGVVLSTWTLIDTETRAAGGSTTLDFSDVGSHTVPVWVDEPTSVTVIHRGYSFLVNNTANTLAVLEPTFTDT